MTIYIDENLAPILAEGFNQLQNPLNFKYQLQNHISVKSIKKEFGKGCKDEYWIPELEKGVDCVITQDYNINRIKEQRLLCEQFELGMFYFRPPFQDRL